VTDSPLPLLLIVDDLFGRTHPERSNEERASLCGDYLLEDITRDEVRKGGQRVKNPVAQVVFSRGQRPLCATPGDIVENDLSVVMAAVTRFWHEDSRRRWAMVLLDLCFYTGPVTEESDRQLRGVPQGRASDDDPEHYFGLQVLEVLHNKFPDLPIVILSSMPRAEVSREFSKRGALGFIERGSADAPERLRDYLWRHGLVGDETAAIVGNSCSLLLCLREARRVSSNRRHLLFLGERGTGKELLAHYVHRHSMVTGPRPLVVVDSGTLSPHLYGSELFGHQRGAFTGADRSREGRILQANGGDLFLDEIGNMPLDVQAGLLRVLEDGNVIPIGSNSGHAVDVRFLSATNKNIEKHALDGEFRSDLLDRLRQGGVISLPPLRERKQDLPLLVEKFVREAEVATVGAIRREVDPETIERISGHSWPGNIRELRNVIFTAVTRHADVEHLVPRHIELPHYVGAEPPYPKHTSEQSSFPRSASLDQIMAKLEAFEFAELTPAQLAGQLDTLQGAFARFLVRYLKAALRATARPTPNNPNGETMIHPAIKLISGNRAITASKASDIIKRIFRWDRAAVEPLLSDPELREACEKASRLRPSGKDKKN
jgi:DNA-binding NtrC family response regulator